MKFRLLTKEEQKVFDEDFKHFLIANGVSNEEWLALNHTKDKKATELVALFSDTVFQKVMEKIEVLELRETHNLLVFNCGKEEIELIGINAKKGSKTIDFSTTESIHQALTQNTADLAFFKQSKPYSKERELEIFEMIEKGCLPSHRDFWNTLTKAIS